MTCAQGLLRLLWGGPKLECYGTDGNPNITTSTFTHSYRAAFNKRNVLNALSKLMYTAAWLCNQCFLLSAAVELGTVIYNDVGIISPNWKK